MHIFSNICETSTFDAKVSHILLYLCILRKMYTLNIFASWNTLKIHHAEKDFLPEILYTYISPFKQSMIYLIFLSLRINIHHYLQPNPGSSNTWLTHVQDGEWQDRGPEPRIADPLLAVPQDYTGHHPGQAVHHTSQGSLCTGCAHAETL